MDESDEEQTVCLDDYFSHIQNLAPPISQLRNHKSYFEQENSLQFDFSLPSSIDLCHRSSKVLQTFEDFPE